jgi:hypothetical protein
MRFDNEFDRETPRFAADSPRPLFHTLLVGDSEGEEYRVTSDGQRFLLRVNASETIRATLIQNWPRCSSTRMQHRASRNSY